MATSAKYRSSYAVESELTAIAESTRDSIIGLTPQGVITSWNPAAARLYGYAPEEIVGQPAQVLYPQGQQAEETEFLRRTTDGEQVSRSHVGRRRKDGTTIAVSLTAVPVVGAAGTVVGVATVSSRDPAGRTGENQGGARTDTERHAVRDDQEQGSPATDGHPGGTERERLVQAQLQQAQRLENLGQLAGGVAHDFNNLLAVILNYVAFVREELAAATESDWASRLETARDDLAQVTRAADRAASLTRQLLAFARREVVRPQVLDLDTVVTDVEDMLRRTLGEHVELVISLAGHLWPVLADPGQLEQVLVNLAVNARDAMPAGGTLTIDTRNTTVDADSIAGGSESPQGRNVRLRVSDTGTGMSPDVVDHAFEPFFTTKNEGAGTGLGLATVYGILAQNEGHIHIYSHPGTGTTFSIMLPVTAEAAVPLPVTVPYQRRPKGETVLVVEDEDALREVTKRIFARNGYRVITAANGPEAIQIARTHPSEIHLLITDVVMPHMLGKDVAAKVRDIRPEIEVLFMSGYAQPVLTSQGRLAANVALVEKPFSEADLLAKAGQVLNGKFRGFTTVKGDGA
jgi:PAS domain S-box-containing protein